MVEINTKFGLNECVTRMEKHIIDGFVDKYRFQIGIPVSGRHQYLRNSPGRNQGYVRESKRSAPRPTETLDPIHN